MILVPNGRHLRIQHTYRPVSLLRLDPARGEGEVGEDSIQQQHDGVWWWRSVVLQQGFAKHRKRRGGGGVGLRQEGEELISWQPQVLKYI